MQILYSPRPAPPFQCTFPRLSFAPHAASKAKKLRSMSSKVVRPWKNWATQTLLLPMRPGGACKRNKGGRFFCIFCSKYVSYSLSLGTNVIAVSIWGLNGPSKAHLLQDIFAITVVVREDQDLKPTMEDVTSTSLQATAEKIWKVYWKSAPNWDHQRRL